MTRVTALLAAVLAAQIGAAVFLAVRAPDHAAMSGAPLLTFERSQIDQIAIDDSEGASVALRKDGDQWIIPDLSNFPADTSKVENLLSKVEALKTGWPVATTTEAAERFKVTEETHERRIVLSGGGKTVGELLVGTSPGFRRSHVKAGDGAEIFSVEFPVYEAGARREDWMDRNRLATSEEDIAKITVADVALERKDGKFVIAGLAEGEKADAGKVSALVRAIARPTFETVVGEGDEATNRVEPAEIQITIERSDGKTVTRKYKKDGETYLFVDSSGPHLFRATASSADAIVKASRAALLEPAEAEKEGEAEQSSEAAAPASETAPPTDAQPSGAAAPADAQPPKAAEPAASETAAPVNAQPSEAAAPASEMAPSTNAQPSEPAASETAPPANAPSSGGAEPAETQSSDPAKPEEAQTPASGDQQSTDVSQP